MHTTYDAPSWPRLSVRFTGLECFHIFVHLSPCPSLDFVSREVRGFFCFFVCTIWCWKASHCFSSQFFFYREGAACGQVLWTLGVSALQSSAWSELPEAPDSSLRELRTPSLGTGRLRCPLLPSFPTSAPPAFSVLTICSFLSHAFELFFKVALSCLIHLRPSPSILPRNCSRWI